MSPFKKDGKICSKIFFGFFASGYFTGKLLPCVPLSGYTGSNDTGLMFA